MNIEKEKSILLAVSFISAILFIGSLLSFIISKSPSDLFVSSAWIFFIIISILRLKNYQNKIYLAVLVIITYQGLILVYSYLFTPFYKTNQLLFYFFSGIFILLLISFVYFYPRRNHVISQ